MPVAAADAILGDRERPADARPASRTGQQQRTVSIPPTDDLPELTFAAGLPGFPRARRFALVRWGGDDSPFSLLRCLDDPDLAFVVVPPGVFFPEYEVSVDDETAQRLGLHDPDDAVVLVVVTVGERAADATANLLAPIVIHRTTRAAAQVVLAGSGFDLRAPLVGA